MRGKGPTGEGGDDTATEERGSATRLYTSRRVGRPRPDPHPVRTDDGVRRLVTALFAAGAYLGRDLHRGLGLVAFIAAFACLIGMQFAVRKSLNLTVGSSPPSAC